RVRRVRGPTGQPTACPGAGTAGCARRPSTRTYPRAAGRTRSGHRRARPDRLGPDLQVVVGRVTDPELAVEVGAPAVHHRPRGQRAGVPVTGGDRDGAGERGLTVPVAH